MVKRTIPAVVYYRMSSDRQEASIEQQRIAVEKYAKDHGYRILREYIDEGISGDATEKRFGFQRMVQDCSSGDFDVVLCWDQDRFGRFDPLEAGFWIKPMRDAGVHLETVAQGPIDWNDFAGRIVWTVQQEAKYAYLGDLSRNVLRGQAETASRGEWNGGPPPFGYIIENKRLIPGDQRHIKTVKKLFREYLSGKSLRGIADELNSKGIKSPRGRSWTGSGVRTILTNVAYIGTYVWNTSSQAKYNRIIDGKPTKARKKSQLREPNEKSEWFEIESNHDALIDKKTFDKVQQRLKERKTQSAPHRNGGSLLFTGLAYCEHCGHKMQGFRRGKNTYVVCGGSQKHGKSCCNYYSTQQTTLLNAVVDALQDRFTSPEAIEKLRAEMKQQISKSVSPKNVKQLERSLEEIKTKLKKSESRLLEVDSDMVPIVQEHIRGLQQEKQHIEAALKEAETPQDDLLAEQNAKIDRAIHYVHKLRETVGKAKPQVVREFLNEAVARIDCRFSTEIHGSKPHYRLEGGSIKLRPNEVFNLCNTANLFGTHC